MYTLIISLLYCIIQVQTTFLSIMDQIKENFKCQCCQITFENSQQLFLHTSYHTSYRSFLCIFCSKIHRRERPYDRVLHQNSNRYVNCNSRNEQIMCHKVTHVTQEYAEECTVEDLDIDNMSIKETKVIKEMLAQLEHYEQENQ